MPFAFHVWNRDLACLISPQREGGSEVFAYSLALTTVRDVTVERCALGVIQSAVSFSEDLRLSLSAVHDGRGEAE
jgi:hypothetical protein